MSIACCKYTRDHINITATGLSFLFRVIKSSSGSNYYQVFCSPICNVCRNKIQGRLFIKLNNEELSMLCLISDKELIESYIKDLLKIKGIVPLRSRKIVMAKFKRLIKKPSTSFVMIGI